MKNLFIHIIISLFTFSCTVKGIICEDKVNLYSEKDINSKVIGNIIIGDYVDVIKVSKKLERIDNFDDYFYLVNYYNKKGWVFGRSVISTKNKTKINKGGKPVDYLFPYTLSEDLIPEKIKEKVEIIRQKDEKSYDIRLHYYSRSGDKTSYYLPKARDRIEKSDLITKFASSIFAEYKKYPDIKDSSGNSITTWIDSRNKKSLYQKLYYKYDQQGKVVTAFWLTPDYRQNTEYFYENDLITEIREYSHYRKENFEEKPNFKFKYHYKARNIIRIDCYNENNYLIWHSDYTYSKDSINIIQYRTGDRKILNVTNYKIIRDNIIEDMNKQYYYNDKGFLEKIEEKDRITGYKYKFYY